MTLKTICRYNPVAGHGTVIRITYADGRKQCSIGVRPKLWEVHREAYGTIYTILGLRVHFKTSYGGRFAD